MKTMYRSKFLQVFLVLSMLLLAPVVNAASFLENIDRFELGVSAGVGFYVGQSDPLGAGVVNRVQSYNALGFGDKATLGWPGIETFGFSFGYRFDSRWLLRAQTTRQRLCYAEYLNDRKDTRNIYYNAMWHLDVMAEYNILNYGSTMSRSQSVYNVVPYVGFGVGITMFNKESTLRKVYGMEGYVNSFYPGVANVGVGMYIPMAVGVKYRINEYVQLKGTFQYQLYVTPNSNLEGGSYNKDHAADRPKFEDLNQSFGANHDCLFSISAIFNIGKYYEDRLIIY